MLDRAKKTLIEILYLRLYVVLESQVITGEAPVFISTINSIAFLQHKKLPTIKLLLLIDL
jgi:hypothetical protein